MSQYFWHCSVHAAVFFQKCSLYFVIIFWKNTFSSLLVPSSLESSWSHCPLSGHSGSVQYWNAEKNRWDDKVPQVFLYILQDIFGGLLGECTDYSHVQKHHVWEHKATQSLSVSVSVGVCVCSHILSESFQRLPSTDPLTSGTMSQWSAVKKTLWEKWPHSTSTACLQFCVCVCVCALTDLRSCRMWCWTLSMERSLAGWPSKDPLSIRCLVQALEYTNTFFFSSWSI